MINHIIDAATMALCAVGITYATEWHAKLETDLVRQFSPIKVRRYKLALIGTITLFVFAASKLDAAQPDRAHEYQAGSMDPHP